MNKKYPIDTPGRIKAAWAYIQQPSNAAKYTEAEQRTIKLRIRRAAEAREVALPDRDEFVEQMAGAEEESQARGGPSREAQPSGSSDQPGDAPPGATDLGASPTAVRTVEQQIVRLLEACVRRNELERLRALEQRRATILRLSTLVSPAAF